MWMCNIQIIKNGNDIRRIWLKMKTISQSFIHCIPALKKKLKIFPFENPMSSVSRESSRLKSFTGIQSNLLRSRLAAFKGVFNSCRSSIASKIEKWKICTELKSFNYMDFKVTFLHCRRIFWFQSRRRMHIAPSWALAHITYIISVLQ